MASNRRQHIVRVASGLIHVSGYHSTSLDAILQTSGVKKGNFYFYFRSKEELGFAVISHQVEIFRQEHLAPILSSPLGPLEKLGKILDALLEEQSRAKCRGGCPFGNMALELSDTHEGFRAQLQHVFGEMSDLFCGLLRQASSELREGTDFEEVSQFIVASVEGAIMLSKVHKGIAPMQRCIRQLKSHLDSLRRPAGPPAREGALLP